MSISVDTYERIDQAADALGSARDARFLGGGTLVMRAVNYGDQSFSRIIRTTDKTLRQITSTGGRIVAGAGVTMSQILASRDLAFLAPVANVVGGPAIRNMATLGGNLFAEHPYGDLATALLVLDTKVQIAGRGTIGELALDEFLRDRGRLANMLVASVSLVRPERDEFRFLKVSRVKPKGVAVMSLAAWLPLSGNRVSGARIAYGAMGTTPLRVTAVERALEGATLDHAGIEPALRAATDGLTPPTDPIASAWYRQQIAPVHLGRLLLDAGRGGTR